MTIEWLAGNRIRGTSTERTTTSGFNPVSAVLGGWKEVGRTTLGANAGNIAVDSLSDKKYYMVLADLDGSATRELCRLNSDSGTNYAHRYSSNGATDGTGTNATKVELQGIYNTTDERFKVFHIANKSDKEKLVISHSVNMNGSGAGNPPNRYEVVGKWTNTSNAISKIDLVSWGSSNVGSSGDWQSGSEVVVLGYDPDDTHTDNFWEELADVTLSGTGTNISSGTITAKKYLWFQLWYDVTAGADANLTFNNNTTSTYALRRSANGGSDVTSTSQTGMNMQGSGAVTPVFINGFIINTSANEKLIIAHQIEQNTAGAGNAPNRREFVGKWANTSSQITELDFTTTSNNYTAGSFLKVWGAD